MSSRFNDELYFSILKRVEEEKAKHKFPITAYEVVMKEFEGTPGAKEIIDQFMDEEG